MYILFATVEAIICCTLSYDITTTIEKTNWLAKLVFATHLINIFDRLVDNFLEAVSSGSSII